MMFQQTIVIGRLGKDPEGRFTPAGQQVTTFPVATDRHYTDKAGKAVKITTWFRVQAWGKIGEACAAYLKKGKMVMVRGHLNSDPESGGPRIWTSDDGKAHAGYELTAETVKFLSPVDHQNDATANGPVGEDMTGAVDIPY